jgi:hypothetical protein
MLYSNLTKIFERINCAAPFFFLIAHVPDGPDFQLKPDCPTRRFRGFPKATIDRRLVRIVLRIGFVCDQS